MRPRLIHAFLVGAILVAVLCPRPVSACSLVPGLGAFEPTCDELTDMPGELVLVSWNIDWAGIPAESELGEGTCRHVTVSFEVDGLDAEGVAIWAMGNGRSQFLGTYDASGLVDGRGYIFTDRQTVPPEGTYELEIGAVGCDGSYGLQTRSTDSIAGPYAPDSDASGCSTTSSRIPAIGLVPAVALLFRRKKRSTGRKLAPRTEAT